MAPIINLIDNSHCTFLQNSKFTNSSSIGVNRPAIVRELPHFGLFPAFLHFGENVPHFWLYFEIAENRINFR